MSEGHRNREPRRATRSRGERRSCSVRIRSTDRACFRCRTQHETTQIPKLIPHAAMEVRPNQKCERGNPRRKHVLLVVNNRALVGAQWRDDEATFHGRFGRRDVGIAAVETCRIELVIESSPPRHAREVAPHVIAAFLSRSRVHDHGVGFHFAALDVLQIPHCRQGNGGRARKLQCLDDSDSTGHGSSLDCLVVQASISACPAGHGPRGLRSAAVLWSVNDRRKGLDDRSVFGKGSKITLGLPVPPYS